MADGQCDFVIWNNFCYLASMHIHVHIHYDAKKLDAINHQLKKIIMTNQELLDLLLADDAKVEKIITEI